ncbi:MAG: DUF3999 family protein [Candidatus Vogelbacteria bacterium]|nr:DUF3999 family protein [Candidatus Vogelbacteria bacterium]
MKLAKIFLATFLLFAAFNTFADFNQKLWQYQSKITVDNQSKGGYATLDIPSTVFEKLNSNLSDLRIVNEDGEVPFVAATQNAKNYTSDLPGRVYNLGTKLGISTSFEIDLGQKGLAHSGVTIETPSENFKRGVEVYGSNDTANWQLLNGKGQIFDYTNREGDYINSRYTTISYPEGTWKFLRVVINDSGEIPLNITGAKVTREVKENAKEISYTPAFEVSENSKNKSTDVVLDLGQEGIPHSGGELSTNSEIFSRGVVVYESADKNTWSTIGQGYIFSVDTPKFAGQNLSFNYSESRKRYVKISILNQDDKPINILSVKLSGTVRNIIFKYNNDKHYALFMGNPKAVASQYDFGQLVQYIDTAGLLKADVGPIETNSDYVTPQIPLSESSPYILPTFLVVVVIILFILVARLFMTTKKQ